MVELIGIRNEKFTIESKENEDTDLLRVLDGILTGKRGFTVKLPPGGSAVACCMSGGADSVANIFIMLNEFGYITYPFFINRGQSAYEWERKAVNYYDRLFSKRFPSLYNKTLEIRIDTPAREYKDNLRDVKKAMADKEFSNHISYPARNSIIFLTGMEYAYSLRKKGVYINTLFSSHLASDSSFHCSQTWQRLINLEMCHILHDWNFQFISLPIETSLNNYFDKDVLIRYCHENDFDLTQTRTCVKDTQIQCGTCPCCWDRRRSFLEAGIVDKTKYLSPFPEIPGSYY
jgi:7-cyano-7-deazaguanine synthase in queuosine biosynthesis